MAGLIVVGDEPCIVRLTAVRNVSSVMVTGAPLLTLTLEDDPTPSSDWMLHVTSLHLHTHLTTTYLLLGSLRSASPPLYLVSQWHSVLGLCVVCRYCNKCCVYCPHCSTSLGVLTISRRW